MKTKNRTFKIILLLTLTILMIAIMAVFPLVNNASAVYTTETHISVADSQLNNLKGETVFFHTDLIEEDGYLTLSYDGLTYFSLIIDNGMRGIFLTYGLMKVLPDDPEQINVTIAITTQEPFTNDIVEYTFPDAYDFIIDTSIQNDVLDVMYIDIEFTTEPIPEPTEEPENPINKITDFLSKELIAGFTIGTLLLVLLVYKIFIK